MRHLFFLLALSPTLAVAQPSVRLGADLVSRYVWRGFDFGQSASIQPTIEFGSGGLAVGTWGSFALRDAGADELDLYVRYSTSAVTVGVTDYYFSSASTEVGVQNSADYFNFAGDGDGAHYIEPFVTVSGDAVLPLSLTVATVVYNDPTFSTYLEASYTTDVSGTEIGLAVGSVFALSPGDGPPGARFYGTSTNGAMTNLSLSVAREIPLTEQFALPAFGSYTINPETERAFLVFGISL